MENQRIGISQYESKIFIIVELWIDHIIYIVMFLRHSYLKNTIPQTIPKNHLKILQNVIPNLVNNGWLLN